jgi:pentatricopeptide repeat protein
MKEEETMRIWPKKRIIHQKANISTETHNQIQGHGQLKEAINPFNTNAYAFHLQVCADANSLAEGKNIHAHIEKTGIQHNDFLRTKLISMYTKCRSMADARLIFDRMTEPIIFVWNAMIRGYAANGFFEDAIAVYYRMWNSGVMPDKFTFPCVLKACAGLYAPQHGKEVHGNVVVMAIMDAGTRL